MKVGQWNSSPAMIAANYFICTLVALLSLGGSVALILSSAPFLAAVCAIGTVTMIYLIVSVQRVRSIKIDNHSIELQIANREQIFIISEIEGIGVFMAFDLWIKYQGNSHRYIGIPESVLNDLVVSVRSQIPR